MTLEVLQLLKAPKIELIRWMMDKASMPELLDRLEAGTIALFAVKETECVLAVSVGKAVDAPVTGLWLEALAGSGKNNPKKDYRVFQAILRDCEYIARLMDASEIRVEASTRNRLKQNLLGRAGFTLKEVGQFLVMRKVVKHG